jgi:Helix-turn-helix domain
LSVRHIGLVLDHLQAPPPVKLVALILADHADSDGICWPSYRRIAERSCLAGRTVRRYVHELIDAGVVTQLRVGHVTTVDGRRLRLTSAYRVNADVLAGMPSLLSTGDPCIVASHGHLEVAESGQGRWSDTATKPSVEPSSLTVSGADVVDNSHGGDCSSARFDHKRQNGSLKRLGDVLASMGESSDRASGGA